MVNEFEAAFSGSFSDSRMPPELLALFRNGVSRDAQELIYAASAITHNREILRVSSAVFVSAPVYSDLSKGENLNNLYQDVNDIDAVIRGVGLTPVRGVDLKLHSQSSYLAACKTHAKLALCSLHVVDGRKRLGSGSINEAESSLWRGVPTAFIVSQDQYAEAMSYLGDKSKKPPASLPPYYGWAEVKKKNLITIEQLPKWLLDNRVKLQQHPELLDGRGLPQTFDDMGARYRMRAALVDKEFQMLMCDFLRKMPLPVLRMFEFDPNVVKPKQA